MMTRKRRSAIEARNRRIVALAIAGVRPREIRRVIDNAISIDAVTGILRRARETNPKVPRFTSGGRLVQTPAELELAAATMPPAGGGRGSSSTSIWIPGDLLAELARPAARRGLTVAAFIRHVMRTIVDEDMLRAVLDDGLDARPRATIAAPFPQRLRA